MRTLIILPALIALFATPFALAGETVDTTVTATAAKPWYIGPKGGDIRKAHTASPSELGSAAATPKPWYIGPKGGDIRKTHTASPSELGSVAATPKPWYIGPKGGDTRKGA
jgi:hypothetical protein